MNSNVLAKPRAILFDLDGTLLDSAPDLAAAVNTMRIKRGLAPVAYDLLRPQASKGARGLLGVAFNLHPLDAEFDAHKQEFFATYEAAMAVESRLFDGVSTTLNALADAGIAWGIVTNKIERFGLPLVPAVGLGSAGCIICGDTTPHSKPHPAPLLAAAAQLGVAPKACWYVGDDDRDIE
ncbi:MAG: HAD hydrolase-like protein [Burkholderiales bacterium]|nr:HAD hydrolase-like protein [Burkholderiales bacterium]